MSHWIRTLFERRPDLGAAPTPGTLEIQIDHVADPASALARLEAFGGQGWLCLTDRIIDLGGGRIPGGIPLSAEICKGEESLHLRQDGAEWAVGHIRRASGSGWITTEHFARAPRGVLTYEVAWTPDENGVLAPAAARLARQEVD